MQHDPADDFRYPPAPGRAAWPMSSTGFPRRGTAARRRASRIWKLASRRPEGPALSMEENDLIIRPITGAEELGLFCQLPYVLNEELAGDLADGRRRPDWMWVALRGSQLLARAAWWTRRSGDAPLILDVLDVDDSSPDLDRADILDRLLRAAMAATSHRRAASSAVQPVRPAGLARQPGRAAASRRPHGGPGTDRCPALRRAAAPGMAARFRCSGAQRAPGVPPGP